MLVFLDSPKYKLRCYNHELAVLQDVLIICQFCISSSSLIQSVVGDSTPGTCLVADVLWSGVTISCVWSNPQLLDVAKCFHLVLEFLRKIRWILRLRTSLA